MIQAALLWTALVGGLEATIEPLSGDPVPAQVTALSADTLTAEVNGTEQKFPVDDLLRVTLTNDPSERRGNIWITLTDGSTLEATGYQVAKGTAKVELASGATLTVSTRSLATVRFKELQTEKLQKQWDNILEDKEVAGDVIVIRKETAVDVEGSDDKTTVAALDYLDGVFGDVTADVVKFVFDDNEVDVKRAKVQGMIYYHPRTDDFPSPLANVVTTGGSKIAAKAVTLEGDKLVVTTLASASVELPLNQVGNIDFSAGKITFLAELTPTKKTWQPFVEAGPLGNKLNSLFAPRMNESFEGGPLQVNNQNYDRGIALHSKSEVEFRLHGPYRKLLGIAGIDDRVSGGNVQLIITGDGRELFNDTIASDQQPVRLDIDITDVRKLNFLVNYGENLDIGDHLDLCNLRVTK